MADQNAVRVELALRGAHLAKMALEFLTLPVSLAQLHIQDIRKELETLEALFPPKSTKGGT